MAVINTLSQLNKLIEQSKKKMASEELVVTHRHVLCSPIKEHFLSNNLEEIHINLLNQGLFNPFEVKEIERMLEGLEKKNSWQVVQDEFERLFALWKGVDIPIYIYPLTKEKPASDIEVKKNGVTYEHCLFLFISADLEENELKALVAHEYHHACRLAFLNKRSEEIELLDSLILEGMAEYAVEILYGEDFLSPWTKGYSIDTLKEQWEMNYKPYLHLAGVQYHFPYLYGSEQFGIPEWTGYCLGYQLIKSFMNHHQSCNLSSLLYLPSRQILEDTIFN